MCGQGGRAMLKVRCVSFFLAQMKSFHAGFYLQAPASSSSIWRRCFGVPLSVFIFTEGKLLAPSPPPPPFYPCPPCVHLRSLSLCFAVLPPTKLWNTRGKKNSGRSLDVRNCFSALLP